MRSKWDLWVLQPPFPKLPRILSWLVCRGHYCYSARLFKPLYLGQVEETLRSYKIQEVSVSNHVQNDCKAHENSSAIRLARYALAGTGVIFTIMNFTGLEWIDLRLLMCLHPSAYQMGTRDRLPRDMVTEAWASPITCIYYRGLEWKILHRNFLFMLSRHLHYRYTKRRPQSPHSNRILFPWWHNTVTSHYTQVQNLVNMLRERKYFIQELRMQTWDFKYVRSFTTNTNQFYLFIWSCSLYAAILRN